MLESTVPPTNKEDSKPKDCELIKSALGGNQQSYELLLARYQERLFRSISNVVGCPTLAEDIVQEAFVRAFLNLDTFRNQCNFYTWLYRIALNARRPYFRKSLNACSIDSTGERIIADNIDPPDARVERSEECRQVRCALERLESHHRKILILREFDGFDYDAIAEILRINKGTVRSRLSRARARLRMELTSYVRAGSMGEDLPVLTEKVN